jgi:hypothetical protein
MGPPILPAPPLIGRKRILRLLENLILTFKFTLEVQHVGLTRSHIVSYSR